jgi:hypothetical protein
MAPRRKARDAARAFGERVYPRCPRHAAEARAVYRVLERCCRVDLAGLDPDTTVSVLFEAPGLLDSRPGDLEPLVAAKLLEQAGLELGERLADTQATRVLWSGRLFSWLLGPAAECSSWSPATIWVRSIRGVVNERVRRSESRERCTCESWGRPTSGCS